MKEMQTEFNEKQLFIQQTSDESIEFVVNWFQRLINEIIECQTQIIENIQHERDRAFEQLDEFEANLSSCQIKKQIDLPEFHLIQPRYEISYQFHNQNNDEEENWDLETTDSQYQPTTTAVNLFSNNLQTVIKPKDDDEIIVEDLQIQSDTIDKIIRDTGDYYLDPTIYYPGRPIRLNCDINLISSNGNHLLCYSRQTKQIVYIYDENLDPITLSWYHGHIIQFVWFDQIKSFVVLTDHQHYEIYTIELTNSFRLKIRLRTYLTTKIDEIHKEKILLQTDANHLFIYYEKLNERKYLRLLNLSFECVRLYSLDKYVSSQEKILALGIDDRHIVLFIRSVDGLCLLIINKLKMCFIDRWILSKESRESQLIVYFQTISSYFLLEHSILRFYQFDKQIGELDLNSTTSFSSIVLQNDGSFIFSNNTNDLLMKTLQSLYEDLIYVILSKCSSSIDVWNLLIALDYKQEKIIDLTAFWSHIRLSSYENKDRLFLFIRQIAAKCVDLRLDNFHWMNVIDLRRLLSTFRLIVRFHSGNVSLSRSLIVNDLKTYFPFLKSLHLIISLDDEIFSEIFNSFYRLETISLVRQNSHEGCLTNQNAQSCLRSFSDYLSQVNYECRVLSLEEHGYEIEHRFLPMSQPEKISSEPIDFCLTSNLKHFILAFRSTSNTNLVIKRKNFDDDRLNLQTFVLPCLPSRESIENLNLKDLILLDLGLINNKNKSDLIQLDEYLNRCSSLRNFSIQLSNWQSTRLISQQPRKVSSIFENCFDDLTPTITTENIPSTDDYHLEFLDDDNNRTVIFNFPLKFSWLNQLTNLNLTGIHCHSNEFQSIFDSLILLQTLSLSPCLLIYLNSMQCTCQTNVYEMHSMPPQISSLNLVSHLTHLKDQCPILTEQYHHHCLRFSSIHQNLPNEKHVFQYEQLFRQILRRICRTYDFLHLSVRIPHYDLQIDDLDIQKNNHLETLVLDMKMPITFHTKLSWIYSENLFHSLKRLILISEAHFELTPMLIDRFQFLEILEIIAIHSHLSSSTIRYLESHLKPKIYPNLQIFRFWIRSVDAKHLLKHLRKTVRLAFESSRPSFQLDISTFNSARPCILFNHSHEIHRRFHSFPSSRSQQLTISYPNYLNFKPLYNEIDFDM